MALHVSGESHPLDHSCQFKSQDNKAHTLGRKKSLAFCYTPSSRRLHWMSQEGSIEITLIHRDNVHLSF